MDGMAFEAEILISDSVQATMLCSWICCKKYSEVTQMQCMSSSEEAVQISIGEGSVSKEELEAKEEFLALMSRGGLLKPTDILFITCIHALVV